MNYIGGNWEKGLGATYASINPRNETILWEGNYASKDQIKSAIDCASKAHFKWSSLSFKAVSYTHLTLPTTPYV